MLNIGMLWSGGVIVPYHGAAVGACIAAGWSWVHELVWHKTNANPIQQIEKSTDVAATRRFAARLAKRPDLTDAEKVEALRALATEATIEAATGTVVPWQHTDASRAWTLGRWPRL